MINITIKLNISKSQTLKNTVVPLGTYEVEKHAHFISTKIILL